MLCRRNDTRFDPASRHFLKYDPPRKLTFGILDEPRPANALPNRDVTARSLHQTRDRTTFHLSSPFGASEVCVPLFGRHTVANILAAVPYDPLTVIQELL